MMSEQEMERIIGCWRIKNYRFETSDGQLLYPWGKKPVGWFIVDADGNMSAQIMHEHRPKMDQPPADKQASAAYKTYVAYFGKTELQPDTQTLVTKVVGALNPDWVGGEQVRTFHFDGQTLILSTPPIKMGDKEIKGVIEWERQR